MTVSDWVMCAFVYVLASFVPASCLVEPEAPPRRFFAALFVWPKRGIVPAGPVERLWTGRALVVASRADGLRLQGDL
jgi:hypothetical protein